MAVRAAAAAALVVAAALVAAQPLGADQSYAPTTRAERIGGACPADQSYAPAPAPPCPPGARASPARPWVCYSPSVVNLTAAPTLSQAASRAACAGLSARTPGAVAGGLATAADAHEWGAMEAACAVDARYMRYWIGLRVNATRSNRTRAAVDWVPVDGDTRTNDGFANALVTKPAWAHSACDCRWGADMPCNVKQTGPAPLSCTLGGTACVHMATDPTADFLADAPWWQSGPAKWVARNDASCETPFRAACCELHFNRSTPPFSAAGAGAAAERRPNLPPAFSPSQTWGAFDAAAAADARVGHGAQRGTTVLRVRAADPDPPGTPAGIVSLRLVGAEPDAWVYVDPARLALLYSGPSEWSRLDTPPPPTGVSRVYTVVAVDGLGCESATALTVRVTVLPSVPVGPWSPCPTDRRVGSAVVGWTTLSESRKCYARGPHAGALRHPAQTGGLPWSLFVPPATLLGCNDLQPGSRVARAPTLSTTVSFFDAAGRFVPGGVVNAIDYAGDFTGLLRGCGMGAFDSRALDPVWVAGHWRNSSFDGFRGCRWKWVDDGAAALVQSAGPSGGRTWASLCDANLRNSSDEPGDGGATVAGGAICMSAVRRERRAGDPPGNTPPLFLPRRCEDQLPPCCEFLRTPRNFDFNTPPRFSSKPRLLSGGGDAERFDKVFIAPVEAGLSLSISAFDDDQRGDRCGSSTACAGAEFMLERVVMAGATHRALISDSDWRKFRVRWLTAVEVVAHPTASQYFSVTMRACDGLGACTDSDIAREPANAGYIQPDLELTLLALACSGPCTGDALEAVPCRIPVGWTVDSYSTRDELDGDDSELALDASRPIVNRLCLPWSTLAFGEPAEFLFSQRWAPQAGAGWGPWVVQASVLLGGVTLACASALACGVLAWRAAASISSSYLAAATASSSPPAGSEAELADESMHEFDLSPPPGSATATSPLTKPGGGGTAANPQRRTQWQLAAAHWLRDEWVLSSLAVFGRIAAGTAAALFLLCATAIALYTPTARQLPDLSLPRYAGSFRPAGTVWARPLMPPLTPQHVANLTLGLPDVWQADRVAALGAGMPLSVRVPASWLPLVLGVFLALAIAARLVLPLVVLLRVYARCDATLRQLVLGPALSPGAPALFKRALSGALCSLQLLRVYAVLVRGAPASLLLAVLAPCTQYSERYLTAAGYSMLRFAQSAATRRKLATGGARAGDPSLSSGPSAAGDAAARPTLDLGGSSGSGMDLDDGDGGRGGDFGNASFSVARAVEACRASVRIDVLALSATLDVALLGIVAFIVSPHQTHARGSALVTAFELAASLHVLLLCSMALPWRALATVAAALDPTGAGPAPASHVLAAAHRHFEQQRWSGPLALLRVWTPATYDRLLRAHVQASAPLVSPHAHSSSLLAKMAAAGDSLDAALGPGEVALSPPGGSRNSATGAFARAVDAGSSGSSSGSGRRVIQEGQQPLSNPLMLSRNARAASMRAAEAAAAPLAPATPPALVGAHGGSGAPATSRVSSSDSDSGGAAAGGDEARVKLAAGFAHAPAGADVGLVMRPAASPAALAAHAEHPGEKTALDYARDVMAAPSPQLAAALAAGAGPPVEKAALDYARDSRSG